VIADSHSARADLVDLLGVKPDRVDVIPLGVSQPPTVAPGSTLRLSERLRLGGRTLVLAVSTNLPHKNLAVLMEALAQVPPPRRPVLAVVGHGTDDGTLAERAAAVGVSEDVRLLGRCPADQLELLYVLADCLVVPSLHEGFGLPVLEAMARSLPVVCSDIRTLREVAGEAACYFDPRAPGQVAAAITCVLDDPRLAAGLRERGRARAASFSWTAVAQETLASYRRALLR
jgi:glycosyltransferase involved in cell wall biosynthesis